MFNFDAFKPLVDALAGYINEGTAARKMERELMEEVRPLISQVIALAEELTPTAVAEIKADLKRKGQRKDIILKVVRVCADCGQRIDLDLGMCEACGGQHAITPEQFNRAAKVEL